MELTFIILKQIAVMFILMFIGFSLYKKQLVTKIGSKELGSVLLWVVIPLIIIKSFWIEYTPQRANILIQTFILSVLTLLLCIIVSHLCMKKDAIAEFACAFSNAGFIGIPLVEAVLGNDAVFFITSMIALLNILQWTYGVFTMTHSKETISARKITTNPVVISFVIGLLLFFLRIPRFEITSSILNIIGNLNTPLAMIVLGIYLAQANLKEMFTSKELYYICFVRLILIPLIIMLCMKILPTSFFDMNIAILIAASAPAGANVAIFAQQYNKDYTKAVMIVCMTTLLSILTLPFIITCASNFMK